MKMDRAVKDVQCDHLNASDFSDLPSLPLDLLLCLLNLLNPLDIIALRKVRIPLSMNYFLLEVC